MKPQAPTIAHLSGLLLSLFSASEIRRLVRYLPDVATMVVDIPGENATPREVATAAAGLLLQGVPTPTLLHALLRERPGREPDIRRVFGEGGL